MSVGPFGPSNHQLKQEPSTSYLIRTGLGDTTMAKGRSSNRGNAISSTQSLTSLLALPQKPGPLLTLAQIIKEYPDAPIVRLEGDRRQYQPGGKRRHSAHALIRGATRLHIGRVGRSVKRELGLSHSLSFRMPDYVSICLRRKIRREVYLALNKKGRRGSGAPRRRNAWSSIKC